MAQTRHFGDPERSWPEVVAAMRADADAAGDDWLRMQADLVERRVEQHWPGHADGCEVCYGEGMHACPEWTHAINIGITWMLTTRAVSR